MRFGAPWAFLLLLILPLVALGRVWMSRAHQRRLARAGAPELLEALVDAGPRAGRTRSLRNALIALAFAFTCVAVARPQLGMRTEVRKGRGMDVVLALDLSRSMHARDVVPSRLERAKIELEALVEQLRGDRVGLVGFTSFGLPLCPLTTDHAALRLQLEAARPESLPRGGTSIDAAIRAALRMLESAGHPEADRAIVVLTDGEAHLGNPLDAAQAAKKAGVVVHVVGVGSRVGEPIPELGPEGQANGYVKDKSGKTVVSRLEDQPLRSIAQVGGGLVALPEGDGGLDLGPVSAHLSTLKRAELEERTVRVYEERYAWALAPAFLFLLGATLLRPTRPSRLPRLVLGLGLLLLPRAASAQALFEQPHPEVAAGIEALGEGRAEEASEAFETARQTLGDDPRLLYDKALADASRGELDQAMAGFRAAAAASSDPNLRARARYGLGNALRSLKRYDEARSAYREALLDDPALSGARRNLEIAERMKIVQEAQPKNEDGESGEDGEPGEDGEESEDEQQDGDSQDEQQDGDSQDEQQDGDSQDEQQDGDSQDDDSQDQQQDQGEDAPDAGVGPDSGQGSSGAGEDAGTEDAGSSSGPDAGASGPDAGGGGQSNAGEGEPAPDLSRQEAEAILDALQSEEKALERKDLLERFKGRPVEKDW